MRKKVSRPVWVEVNLESIKYNIKQLRQIVSQETLIMPVVKADAYGHGIIPVTRAAIEAGCDRLAVGLPEEGVQLRKAGLKLPIQVLGEVLPSQISLLVDYDLIPTVCKKETAVQLNTLAFQKEINKKVHIKIDTGMGRIGVFPEDTVGFVRDINKMSNLKIEGLITHFARADENNKDYTYQQWNKFNKVVDKLNNYGISIPIKQVANSATVIDLLQMELDLIRPGIMIYGLLPSQEVNTNITLEPALSWKAKIVYLKDLPAEKGISYGSTYITRYKSKIATIPLGYGDGYSRLLSNKGEVLINGQRVPITGRICMDQFMVDVTNISGVSVGNEVVLIGKQGNEKITATELADLTDTINYEVICRITKRVPRIYK